MSVYFICKREDERQPRRSQLMEILRVCLHEEMCEGSRRFSGSQSGSSQSERSTELYDDVCCRRSELKTLSGNCVIFYIRMATCDFIPELRKRWGNFLMKIEKLAIFTWLMESQIQTSCCHKNLEKIFVWKIIHSKWIKRNLKTYIYDIYIYTLYKDQYNFCKSVEWKF